MAAPSIRPLKLDQFSAPKEKFFKEHWIGTSMFIEAAGPDIPIVFGAKGSGKSALARFLVELQHSPDLICSTIDLHDFKHGQVAFQVKQLAKSARVDAGLVLANYWRHLFLLHCLKEVSKLTATDEASNSIKDRINEVLVRHSFQRSDRWIISKIKEFLQWGVFVRHSMPPVILALTPDELQKLEEYPQDESFVDLCIRAAGILARDGKKVCVIIDGLDHVSQADEDGADHSFVLGSIVKAAARLALDTSLNDAFSVKILVPRELFFSIEDRDLDQYRTLRKQLQWDPQSLAEVLNRRLAAACSRANIQALTFSDFIPSSLPNGQGTFEFLIRHSMYRPRQLLCYFQAIKDYADGDLPSPECVFRSVTAESIELTNYFLMENALRCPFLTSELKAFVGCDNVMTFGELRQRLSADREGNNRPTLEYAVSTMYETGSLGLIQQSPAGLYSDPSHGYRVVGHLKEPIHCEFVFKPGASPYWIPQPDETLVAIHPMLLKSFSINSASNYVVG